MSLCRVFAAGALGLAAVVWTIPSAADTAEAMCEVRKGGDLKRGATGPCDFSQRQGYVRIDLRNGETFDLAPTNKAHQFRDQKGNKVKRSAEGNAHVYQWQHRKIIVTFGHPSHAAGSGIPAMPYSTREYSATAYFRCSMGRPTHDQSCPAGIRRGERGAASIHVRRPDGRERVLHFARGDVTSPGPGRLTWSKDREDWYIGIDNTEFYVVPDIALYGD